ncbi:MAG: HAD family hydrolase [Clostridiales bacterium]|nr:HAD family hydrolase [Clostridiales bacterium]
MKFDGYILVSDMDATLLRKNHTISDKNIAAIKYFTENGGRFTVASGRMMSAVRAYLDRLNLNAPAVLHNGAMIYDFEKNAVLFEKNIEPERKPVIKRVFEETEGLGLEVYSNEVVYIYKPCRETERFKTRSYDVVYSMPDKVWDEPWIKYLIIADKREQLDEFEPIFRREYDTGYAVRSGPLYLVIVAGGVSKGKSARKVAKITGCKTLIAVGDSQNDIEMLKEADLSFAVENAEPEVKAAASRQAPSNENDAIAYIVEYLDKII